MMSPDSNSYCESTLTRILGLRFRFVLGFGLRLEKVHFGTRSKARIFDLIHLSIAIAGNKMLETKNTCVCIVPTGAVCVKR